MGCSLMKKGFAWRYTLLIIQHESCSDNPALQQAGQAALPAPVINTGHTTTRSVLPGECPCYSGLFTSLKIRASCPASFS